MVWSRTSPQSQRCAAGPADVPEDRGGAPHGHGTAAGATPREARRLFSLAAVDPLPGDPGAISASGRRLRGLAEMLQEEARRLHGLGGTEGLVGEDADTLRLEATKLADRLAQIVGRHDKTAELLDKGHPPESFQEKSLQLLRVAQVARESQLTHEIPGYPQSRRRRRPRRRTTPSGRAGSATLTTGTARRHWPNSSRAEAAGALVARDIRFAVHDGVKDGRVGQLQGPGRRPCHTLTTIADRVGGLATVAAIAVCIGVPGVSVLTWTARGLTALSAVDHVASAVAGEEGSMLDIGLDAFALATFGTGKARCPRCGHIAAPGERCGGSAVRQETRRQMPQQGRHARSNAGETMQSGCYARQGGQAPTDPSPSRAWLSAKRRRKPGTFRTRELPSVSR